MSTDYGNTPVFIVGRVGTHGDHEDKQFLTLGTFSDKEDAKQFVFANSALVMGAGATPIGLWKMNLTKDLMRTYNSDDLAKYYNKQVALNAKRIADAPALGGNSAESEGEGTDEELLKAFSYTSEQKTKVLKQLDNQIASYNTAIKQLAGRPELQASLQKQLDALKTAQASIRNA